MAEQNESKAQREKESLKIEWFGIDGLLCLIYIIESVVFGWALIYNNDFIVGTFVPYAVAIVTTVIFLKYILQVVGFGRKNRKNSD